MRRELIIGQKGKRVDHKKFKISIHEAGHAVMGHVSGQEIKKVTLKEMDSPRGTEKYLGATVFENFDQPEKFTINEAIRRTKISLAGYASEILFFDSANIGGDDLTFAVKRVEDMMQSEDFRNLAAKLPMPTPGPLDMIENSTIKAFIEYKLHICIKELSPLREAIKLIAEELLEKEELTGAEVSALYSSMAQPTLGESQAIH